MSDRQIQPDTLTNQQLRTSAPTVRELTSHNPTYLYGLLQYLMNLVWSTLTWFTTMEKCTPRWSRFIDCVLCFLLSAR